MKHKTFKEWILLREVEQQNQQNQQVKQAQQIFNKEFPKAIIQMSSKMKQKPNNQTNNNMAKNSNQNTGSEILQKMVSNSPAKLSGDIAIITKNMLNQLSR